MSKRCADSCGYSRKELGKVLAGEAKAQHGGEKGYIAANRIDSAEVCAPLLLCKVV